jgi:hypothetical protein
MRTHHSKKMFLVVVPFRLLGIAIIASNRFCWFLSNESRSRLCTRIFEAISSFGTHSPARLPALLALFDLIMQVRRRGDRAGRCDSTRRTLRRFVSNSICYPFAEITAQNQGNAIVLSAATLNGVRRVTGFGISLAADVEPVMFALVYLWQSMDLGNARVNVATPEGHLRVSESPCTGFFYVNLK